MKSFVGYVPISSARMQSARGCVIRLRLLETSHLASCLLTGERDRTRGVNIEITLCAFMASSHHEAEGDVS